MSIWAWPMPCRVTRRGPPSEAKAAPTSPRRRTRFHRAPSPIGAGYRVSLSRHRGPATIASAQATAASRMRAVSSAGLGPVCTKASKVIHARPRQALPINAWPYSFGSGGQPQPGQHVVTRHCDFPVGKVRRQGQRSVVAIADDRARDPRRTNSLRMVELYHPNTPKRHVASADVFRVPPLLHGDRRFHHRSSGPHDPVAYMRARRPANGSGRRNTARQNIAAGKARIRKLGKGSAIRCT